MMCNAATFWSNDADLWVHLHILTMIRNRLRGWEKGVPCGWKCKKLEENEKEGKKKRENENRKDKLSKWGGEMICRSIKYKELQLRPTKLSQDRYESEAFYICQGQDLAIFVCDRRRNSYKYRFFERQSRSRSSKTTNNLGIDLIILTVKNPSHLGSIQCHSGTAIIWLYPSSQAVP